MSGDAVAKRLLPISAGWSHEFGPVRMMACRNAGVVSSKTTSRSIGATPSKPGNTRCTMAVIASPGVPATGSLTVTRRGGGPQHRARGPNAPGSQAGPLLVVPVAVAPQLPDLLRHPDGLVPRHLDAARRADTADLPAHRQWHCRRHPDGLPVPPDAPARRVGRRRGRPERYAAADDTELGRDDVERAGDGNAVRHRTGDACRRVHLGHGSRRGQHVRRPRAPDAGQRAGTGRARVQRRQPELDHRHGHPDRRPCVRRAAHRHRRHRVVLPPQWRVLRRRHRRAVDDGHGHPARAAARPEGARPGPGGPALCLAYAPAAAGAPPAARPRGCLHELPRHPGVVRQDRPGRAATGSTPLSAPSAASARSSAG